MKNKVYLVSVDDSADTWQVIVFSNNGLEAIGIAAKAYLKEKGVENYQLKYGVTEVKPPYYWIG